MHKSFYQTEQEQQQQAAPMTVATNSFLASTFGWMFLGLLVTAIVAVAGAFGLRAGLSSGDPAAVIDKYMTVLIVSAVAHIILMFITMFAVVRSKSVGLMATFFFLITANMGIMLSQIILVYEGWMILAAFGSTAALFGLFALYAKFTKRNLNALGIVGIMLLFGVFILSIIFTIWYFAAGQTLPWLWVGISVVALIAILLITLYDIWRIADISKRGQGTPNLAIYFALVLYVDFIYIFLRILALFSRSRR